MLPQINQQQGMQIYRGAALSFLENFDLNYIKNSLNWSAAPKQSYLGQYSLENRLFVDIGERKYMPKTRDSPAYVATNTDNANKKIPISLEPLFSICKKLTAIEYNTGIINRYSDKSDGIGIHQDEITKDLVCGICLAGKYIIKIGKFKEDKNPKEYLLLKGDIYVMNPLSWHNITSNFVSKPKLNIFEPTFSLTLRKL